MTKWTLGRLARHQEETRVLEAETRVLLELRTLFEEEFGRAGGGKEVERREHREWVRRYRATTEWIIYYISGMSRLGEETPGDPGWKRGGEDGNTRTVKKKRGRVAWI